MPGPNVLDLVGDIREAVERLPKEQLVDILVYVFKEYVVEGAPPLAAGPVAVQDDLAGMSFAEVVRSLQLRLDLPELELFDVQGDRVTMRLQGRSIPVEVAAARAEPGPAPPPPAAPTPAPVAAPAAAPRAAAVPAAVQQPAPPAPAPPSASSSSGGAAVPAATQQSPAPAGAAAPAGGRGGLLEID